MIGEDYSADMAINPNALDVEWLDQPNRVLYYTRQHAEACHDRDLAKEAMDLEEADAQSRVRKNPGRYGVEKGTEGEIRAAAKQDKRLANAITKYHRLKYNADVLLGVCKALEHRKRALENLVHLGNQEYFAMPKSPRNIGDEWAGRLRDNKRKLAQSQVRERLQRKRSRKVKEH